MKLSEKESILKSVGFFLSAKIDKTITPILARLEAVEKRQPDKGERGDPGRDGRDGQDGKDGKKGKDGVDGLGFDDMTEELADDGRTIIRRYVRGDRVKEFRHSMAVVLDRGVFKEGTKYTAGDGVTWAGSFWIAQKTTTEKPDTGNGWRLAVKRGRDGKDGILKAEKSREPLQVGVPARSGK
ncbi:hypothetical protein [Nitratireductor sp. GCM10026969]|uniref:hypothetical protein n=1 Tax=Nitratireductor sp. GCM10026969 TaxID=3252645 RepID=UPI0036072F98